MKSVYTTERSTGTQVYISYTPAGEPRVRELFAFVDDGPEFGKRLARARRAAQKELTRRRAAAIEGRHEGLRPKRSRHVPTLSEYVNDVYVAALRRSDMKPESREREVQRVTDGTVGRHLGGYSLEMITRSVVEEFVDERLRDGAGAAGVNRDLARLRHLLNDVADREELGLELPRIPWRRLMMQERPRSYRPMRDDEEPRLLQHLRDPIVKAYVEFLFHTGIRPRAALQLRWQHIDLEGMTITVPREINKNDEYRVYPNTRVQEILRGLYAMRPLAQRQPQVTVFCHRNRKPRRSIRTAWEQACTDAKIEGLHVRGMRATAATRLQEGGATELDIKMHLGHAIKSMGVTARYVDPHEEHRRRIAELTIRQRGSNVVPLRPQENEIKTVTRLSSGA
jgi:integrase